ncbi:hypothetical protein EV121DRAFT_214318 [Schizophyllum commune]
MPLATPPTRPLLRAQWTRSNKYLTYRTCSPSSRVVHQLHTTHRTTTTARAARRLSIKNSEHAVALSSDKYAGGAQCGKKITAHHNGKKVVAIVRDLCPGCAANSLESTPSAFKKPAKLGKGNIAVNWKFN